MIGWITALIFVTAFVTWLTVTRLLRNRRQARRERWVPPTPVVGEFGEPRVAVDRTVTKAICGGCGQPQPIDDRGLIAVHDRPQPWTPFGGTDVFCEGSGRWPNA
jgi:hypothetical protein